MKIRPPQDPYRTAKFREEARQILSKDRHDRKHRYKVDTGGAIARALERAYQLGFADARNGDATSPPQDGSNDVQEWTLIPPRARATFWGCCMMIIGPQHGTMATAGRMAAPIQNPGHLEIDIAAGRGAGWRLVNGGYRGDRVISKNTINKLLDLDLLEPAPSGKPHVIISARGHATWQRFLELGGQHPDDMIF
jgi:hypothetical protein